MTSTSSSPIRLLVVVNKHLPGITIYDDDTFQSVCQVETGIAPHEVAVSADGRYAYVPIYGSSGVGKPGTDEHLLHIFRTSDCTEVAAMDTGNYKRPHGVVVGKSGIVYVTSEIAEAVILIDPALQRIVCEIPTGSRFSHMIALNHDETKIYSSNVQSGTISVLDIGSRSIENMIDTGAENQRMTISPDGRWIVSSLWKAGRIAFYRTADNQLDFEVPVEGLPFVSKFSRDGESLFNAGTCDGETCAWKVDVTARKVIATAGKLGYDVGSLEVNPCNGSVYVSDQPTNQITILDPDSWQITKSISTAASPDAMAFALVR